jgi:hypothetical protein
VVLTWIFLLNTGVALVHSEYDAYDFTIAAAAGQLTLDDIRGWFSARMRRERS